MMNSKSSGTLQRLTQLVVLALLACPLLAGCSGPAKRTEPILTEVPVSISLQDYRSGLKMTLINDSTIALQGIKGETVQLRRAAFYSRFNHDNFTKVAADDLLEGILEAFRDRGFGRIQAPGAAPDRATGASTGITIQQNGRSHHVLFSTRLPKEDQQTYADCRKVFMAVYNQVDQYQSASIIPETKPKFRN